MVSTLVKQRKDSVEQFTNAGRQDLADKEKAEITILETYLPPPVSREELEKAVDEAVRTTGASSPKDMGGVMKAVMAGLAGRNADGKLINELSIGRAYPGDDRDTGGCRTFLQRNPTSSEGRY